MNHEGHEAHEVHPLLGGVSASGGFARFWRAGGPGPKSQIGNRKSAIPLFVSFILPALAAVAFAAGPFPGVSAGDQVVVELTNGRQIVGRFMGATGTRLKIGVGEGAPGAGSVTIPVAEVERIERLRPGQLSEAEPSKAPRAKATPGAPAAKPGTGPKKADKPAAEEAKEGTPASDALTDREKELLALLEEFPPGPEWNDERYKEISFRELMRHLMPTIKEARFREIYPDWIAAKALAARLARCDVPGEWKSVLAPKAAFVRFPPDGGWSEARYPELADRLFCEDFELWEQGAELAEEPPDAEKPVEDRAEDRPARQVYDLFPKREGWGLGRYEELAAKAMGRAPLSPQEREFVLAYPDWLEGKSVQARVDADKREPTISYDEINHIDFEHDTTEEGISDTELPDENVSKDNIAPVSYEEYLEERRKRREELRKR